MAAWAWGEGTKGSSDPLGSKGTQRLSMGAPWVPHGPPGPVIRIRDPTFRANVSQVLRLRTKYSLTEFIDGIPGNGPSRAGPDLGSTRAGGKDDGS